MSTLTKSISMFLLSIIIMALLVMVVLGFMLGFTHPLPWILIAALIAIPFIHDKIITRRFLQWQPSMTIGVDLIDNDHKKLLALINQLQTATHYQTDDKHIEKTLDELVDYTKYHFAREEELMRINQYPGYAAHKKLHENMTEKVSQYIEAYRIDKTQAIDHILLFLKTWLINHIKGSDQEYAPYLKITTLPHDQ